MLLWSRVHMLCFLTTTSFTTIASRSIIVTGLTVPSVLSPLFLVKSASGQNFWTSSVPLPRRSMSSSTTDEQQQPETHTSDFQERNQDASSLGLGQKSWRSLIEVSMAKSRKIRGSNYVQLATVDEETGEPRCRTVVFRGFQQFPDDHPYKKAHVCGELSTVLKMCTNSKSRKVSESSAGGEVVWWFPKSSEQYRMRGKLLFVGNGGSFPNQDNDKYLMQARKELWGNLSDPARESFLDEKVPGQPAQTSDDEGTCQQTIIPPGGRDPTTGKPLPPPDSFLLMLLFPHHVDYLNLKENYRQIDELASQEGGPSSWSFQQVNA